MSLHRLLCRQLTHTAVAGLICLRSINGSNSLETELERSYNQCNVRYYSYSIPHAPAHESRSIWIAPLSHLQNERDYIMQNWNISWQHTHFIGKIQNDNYAVSLRWSFKRLIPTDIMVHRYNVVRIVPDACLQCIVKQLSGPRECNLSSTQKQSSVFVCFL